jgi:hypothetical protein
MVGGIKSECPGGLRRNLQCRKATAKNKGFEQCLLSPVALGSRKPAQPGSKKNRRCVKKSRKKALGALQL